MLQAQEIRLVSYSPGATQTLIDLNQATLIVGATSWCPLPQSHPAPRKCDVFNPDLESLIQLKPSCVILPRLANPLWANRCQQAGFKVLLLSAENNNSAASDIRSLGALVNQKDLAEKIARSLEGKSSPDTQSLLIIWDGMMAGENSYLGNPLKTAGYHSPLTDNTWQKVDWETVARLKPDGFLWIENNPNDSAITPSAQHLAELKKIPVVQNLASVQNGRVYGTTSGSDWLPGSGLVRAMEKLRGIPALNGVKPQ